jgi:hypothetical protein
VKIYVAGPMRGYKNFNFEAFDSLSAYIDECGDDPINPAEHDREVYPDIETWEGFAAGDIGKCPKFVLADALRWDLEQVCKADAIALLPGWEKSSGANHERYMAEVTGCMIYLATPNVVGWKLMLDSQQIRVSNKLPASGETIVTNDTTGGKKGAKIERYDLIPVEPLAEVARVYGLGAKKYAERNWEKGYDWSLSYAALQRHVNAFWKGEDTDPECKTCHLANVVFHCFAMMEWMKTHPELDNRPISEQARAIKKLKLNYPQIFEEAPNGLSSVQGG